MPSERFLNLPEEKRERIKRAAVKEFISAPMDQISINRIIKDAKIPRGSFYQYFKDKKDLEQYMIGDFRQYLRENAGEYITDRKGDVFQIFDDALEAIFLSTEHPYCQEMCANIFMQIKFGDIYDPSSVIPEEDREFLKKIFLSFPQNKALTYEKKILIEMLFIILIQAVTNVFQNMEHKNEIVKNYHTKIEIIQRGFEGENQNV